MFCSKDLFLGQTSDYVVAQGYMASSIYKVSYSQFEPRVVELIKPLCLVRFKDFQNSLFLREWQKQTWRTRLDICNLGQKVGN